MSEPAPLSPAHAISQRSALTIIFVIVLCDMLGFGLIIPSLPLYAKQFNASALEVSLLFALYSLCQFVAAPVLGVISDRYGRRPVLILSLLGSVVGYLLLAWTMLAPWKNFTAAIWVMYAARMIQGLAGGNISTAQAYIGDVTPPEKRAAAMGIMGAAFGIGFSAGPAVGAMLSIWQSAAPAFAAAASALLATLATALFLPESRVHKPDEATESWLHPSSFKPVLANSIVANLIFIGTSTMMAYVMMEVIFALYLNQVFGYGQSTVNWFFALVGLVVATIQGGLLGRLNRAFGEWRLALFGPICGGAAMAIYFTSAFEPFVALLVLATILNATGRSLQFPSISALMSQHVGPRLQGTAFGLYMGLSSLARVVGPIVAGALFEHHVTAPFAVAGSILVAAAVWTAAVRARQPDLPPGFAVVPARSQ